MAQAVAVETRGKRNVTLNGTVNRFDLIAHNGTNWVQADANDPTLYAQAIVLADGVSGDVREAASYVRLTDSDAPYTQDAIQYLSGTAGEHTETRPATAGDLVQAVGRAFSTTEVEFDIQPAREVSVTLPGVPYATAAGTLLDTGPAAGYVLAAVADGVTYGWVAPGNAVDILYAKFYWSGNITLDASDTYQVHVSSVAAGEENDATEDTTLQSATALTVTVDQLAQAVLTTGLDAAGIGTPGDMVSIEIEKVAEGTGGDDPILLGCELVYKAV